MDGQSNWRLAFLNRVGHHVCWLDHRVLPEVRAMLAAMMSRVPLGGVETRYREVVAKIADLGISKLHDELDGGSMTKGRGTTGKWSATDVGVVVVVFFFSCLLGRCCLVFP